MSAAQLGTDAIIIALRTFADMVERGEAVIEGFNVTRDSLNTGVQKPTDDTREFQYVKTYIGGPQRVSGFTVFNVLPSGVHQ